MALVHLSDSGFAAFIEKGIAVVDFWAGWCGPCRMFGPIFEAESKRHDTVRFGKYEITDTNRNMAGKFDVRSIPSILAFKDGAVLDTKIGLMNEAELADWIKGLS
ncbi:MAG: thioredoxin [Rickettsiales bacterium]|jgi:thioredoxin|nr:thioredoxin [Rickettsiales bacterium]